MKKIFALLISIAFAPAASGQSPDWKTSWEALVAAAKQEGKVVVSGGRQCRLLSRIALV